MGQGISFSIDDLDCWCAHERDSYFGFLSGGPKAVFGASLCAGNLEDDSPTRLVSSAVFWTESPKLKEFLDSLDCP